MYSVEQQKELSPQEVLQILKDGHWRFRNDETRERDIHEERQESADSQHPIAIIHSCIDSRLPVEMLFDQGIGDIFVSRIAGNVENEEVVAGMEIACRDFGSKVILVMGHEDCGAIKAVCDHHDSPDLKHFYKKIASAIKTVEAETGVPAGNKTNLHKVTLKNIDLTIKRIRESSPILREMEEKGEILIRGAYYSTLEGLVTFL